MPRNDGTGPKGTGPKSGSDKGVPKRDGSGTGKGYGRGRGNGGGRKGMLGNKRNK